MATGIFSTTRVAGEGIALAVVIAVLATFAQTGLADRLAGMGLRAPAGMAEAAQLLATGDLGGAASMLLASGSAVAPGLWRRLRRSPPSPDGDHARLGMAALIFLGGLRRAGSRTKAVAAESEQGRS